MKCTLVLAVFFCSVLAHIDALSTDWNHELNLRTDEWQNEAIYEVNRLPMRSTYFPFETRELALADDMTQSSRFLSLDGDWDFQWFNSATVHLRDQWDTFPVPGIWEMGVGESKRYGYPIYTNFNYPIDKAVAPAIRYKGDAWNGPDYNPTGVYRKMVDIPRGWSDSNVTLHFGAVTSGLYVWFNGHYVGYSEDSKLQAEFDVTALIQSDAQNEIVFKVIEWTDGSYLEDQDMWRLSGISRSVYMYARPKDHVYDIHVRAEPSEDLQSGSIIVQADKDATVEVFLSDRAVSGIPTADGSMEVGISSIQLWSAEHPELYTVLVSAGGVFARFDVGFRRVVLSEGNFLVNGVALKIQGVNRHEHDRRTGRVISTDAMLRDIQLMKQLNFNAVRTSHYPNCEEWLKLCDVHGLYVIGEANIESHGFVTHRNLPPPHDGVDNYFRYNETLANNPKWGPAQWARQQRMYYRDRNHPSIIIWSLANEAGNGVNMVHGYNWFKSVEKNRIVTYEGARKEGDPNNGNRYDKAVCAENTDAYVPMYMPHSYLERYGQQWAQSPPAERLRPLFHIEYQHSMGNGGGGFAQYWEIIEKYQGLQGGFIWDWMDQGIESWALSGKFYYKFGGDFGPADVISDGDFCLNGVLRADQEPQPHAFEIQHVQQFVKGTFEAGSAVPYMIMIRNRFDFTTLEKLVVRLSFLADGVLFQSSNRTLGDAIAPHATQLIDVQGPQTVGTVCHLTLEYASQQQAWWDVSGLYGWDQFEIPCSAAPVSQKKEDLPAQTVLRQNHRAESGLVDVTFNQETGAIQEVSLHGQVVLSNVVPAFWRPVTDNDIGAGLHTDLEYWRNVTIAYKDVSIQSEDGAVVSRATLDFERASLQQTVVVNNSQVELRSVFTPKREACKLAADTFFSLKSYTRFLGIDASDRLVFSKDLTAEFQTFKVQSNFVGDIVENTSFGVDTHFFARAGEPQQWAYKTNLNCTDGELVVGYEDGTWTEASYGTVQLEHWEVSGATTFTQGDLVCLRCGDRYVVPDFHTGGVLLSQDRVALTLSIPDPTCMVPRLGHEMQLPEGFDAVRWFGKGPWDTYTDRRSAKEQVWEASVLEQTWEYGRNQASGNKFGVRWMALEHDGGATVTASSGGEPLEMQAHHYPQELFNATDDTKHGNYAPRNETVIHGGQLVPLHNTWWSIDAAQMGVGGINSWGELQLPDARLTIEARSWSFVLDFNPSSVPTVIA